DTVQLVEGFMGVEEHITDYMLDALETLYRQRSRRNLWLQWGAEEMRHGVAFEQVLVHSGARTEEQIRDYVDGVADRRWTPDKHGGLETLIGGFAYVTVQERATYANYERVRLRIRSEYGLTPSLTPAERQRGKEAGAAEALRRVAVDEIGHHGMFLQILRAYLKYFPDATLESIERVLSRFVMPSVRIIPNRREFFHAVRRTGLQTAENHLQSVV